MGIKEWLHTRKEQKNSARMMQNAVIDDEVSKLWVKCYNCGANLPSKEVDDNLNVCPKCGSSDLMKIDRMNGYLSYSRVKGDTRLNDAKMAEIAERKSM